MASPSSPVFRLTRRAVLRVAGPDARAFLDRLLTRDVAGLDEGEAAYAGILAPQGKIIAELFVFAAADGAFLIDTPAEVASDLIKKLTLYRLRAAVELDDVRADWAVLQAFDAAAALPGLAAADPRGVGVRAIASTPAAAEFSEDGYDAARITLGLPEQGADYGSEEVFPADVDLDLLNGVDFAKGCFIGQEVVSRMKRRGSVRKRTLVVRFDASAPPKGTALATGEATVGALLSGAGEQALALVRLDRLEAAGGVNVPITADGVVGRIAFPNWFPDDARFVGAGE